MDGKNVEAIVQTALEGSRKIVVTLHKDAMDCVTSMWVMNNRGIISLKDSDVMNTVCNKSYDWEKEANRTFAITLPKKFDQHKKSFVNQMYLGIEKILTPAAKQGVTS